MPILTPPESWPLPEQTGYTNTDPQSPDYQKYMLAPMAPMCDEHREQARVRTARKSLDGQWALITINPYQSLITDNPHDDLHIDDVWFLTQAQALCLVAQPEWCEHTEGAQ